MYLANLLLGGLIPRAEPKWETVSLKIPKCKMCVICFSTCAGQHQKFRLTNVTEIVCKTSLPNNVIFGETQVTFDMLYDRVS